MKVVDNFHKAIKNVGQKRSLLVNRLIYLMNKTHTVWQISAGS